MPKTTVFPIWDIKLGVPDLPFGENKIRLQMWNEARKTDSSAVYTITFPVILPLMCFY